MPNRPAVYLKTLLLLFSISMVSAQHEFDKTIDLTLADDLNAAIYLAPFHRVNYRSGDNVLNNYLRFQTWVLPKREKPK